jgi:hypothetical protein
MRQRLGVALALTFALVASGCGDNRLDSGELHDKATEACNKAHQQLVKIPDPKSATEVQPFLTNSSTVMSQLSAALKGLKPPSDAQEPWNLAVGLVNDQAAGLRRGSKQLQQGGDPVVVLRTVADQATQSSERERAAWNGLGIEACANR